MFNEFSLSSLIGRTFEEWHWWYLRPCFVFQWGWNNKLSLSTFAQPHAHSYLRVIGNIIARRAQK